MDDSKVIAAVVSLAVSSVTGIYMLI